MENPEPLIVIIPLSVCVAPAGFVTVTVLVDDLPIEIVSKVSEVGFTEISVEIGFWLLPLNGILMGLRTLSALCLIVNAPESGLPDDGENLTTTVFDSPGEMLYDPPPLTIEKAEPLILTVSARWRVKPNVFVITIVCSSA